MSTGRRFAVLHVCMGNICRSPMAERLLHLALRQRIGDRVDERYLSHGGGTGSWHIGEGMNPPAARQVTHRGGDVSGFRARRVSAELVKASELILCATAEQVGYVHRLSPEAEDRTFVLGEFGRLLPGVSLDGLPEDAYERGVELVARVDAARSSSPGRARPRPADDLDDPWGMGDDEFARIADEIEATVIPLAAALVGPSAGTRDNAGPPSPVARP
jgi:protein-tyrosine phosphatase